MISDSRQGLLFFLDRRNYLDEEVQEMRVRLRDVSVADYLEMVWPFIAAIVIGGAIRVFYPVGWWPDADIVHALADALFVAGVIGCLIEIYSVNFLIRKVADTLAERLVGRGLPTALQALIGEIVKANIVRHNYIKTYRFSDPTKDGYFHIDITLTYEVRNYSDSIKSYKPMLAEEIFYEPEFLYLEYKIPGSNCYSFDQQQLSEMSTLRGGTNKSVSGSEEVKLEPMKKDPSSVCQVTWRYRVKMPIQYSDILSVGGHAIGISIQLERIPEGFEFTATEDRPDHLSGSRSWDSNGPFINGQHVRARWFRKPNSLPN